MDGNVQQDFALEGIAGSLVDHIRKPNSSVVENFMKSWKGKEEVKMIERLDRTAREVWSSTGEWNIRNASTKAFGMLRQILKLEELSQKQIRASKRRVRPTATRVNLGGHFYIGNKGAYGVTTESSTDLMPSDRKTPSPYWKTETEEYV